MNDFEIAFLVADGFIVGMSIGYIIWAPENEFKKAFLDGISLRFIWGRFVK